MIQMQTKLDVADNTGAKRAQCIQVLGGSTARHGKKRLKRGGVGDVIICSVKQAIPAADIKKGEIVRCVVVRTSYPIRRKDGTTVRFDNNAAVIIDEDGNPKGTRVFGPVASELGERNFTKII